MICNDGDSFEFHISAREGLNVDDEVPRVLSILEESGIIEDAASTPMYAEPHPDSCAASAER